jgi:5-methylcytosine-specific restriction endonuclease McrA
MTTRGPWLPPEEWQRVKLEQRQELKRVAYRREGGCCFYCDKPLRYESATMDHIKPKSQGGKLEIGNIVIACFKCNNRRGDYPADMFLILMMTGGF